MTDFTPTVPTRVLPAVTVRDLPDPPRSTWRVIGPGLVGAGVGLASGEFIIWPYIASQVGLVFIWGAAIGIITQWFLNMEIERYTLATGETALTGFSRMWKHWGLVFVLMTLESACIPVPSEAIMLFAGVAVSQGELTLFDIVPAQRYTLLGKGKGGLLGLAEGAADIVLSDLGPDTLLVFTARGGASGQIMRMGKAIIGNSAQKVIDGFFERFGDAMGAAVTPLGVE